MRKISAVVDRSIYYLVGLLLVALVVILFSNIVLRFFFHLPLPWVEEVSVLIFLWVVFIGAAAVQKKGGHVAIVSAYNQCPPFVQKVLDALGLVFTTIILGILTVASLKMVRVQCNSMTPALMIPYSVFGVAVVISSLHMLIYTSLSMIDKIAELAKKIVSLMS